MTYLEECVFRAVDDASRPISAINKALAALHRTQEKLSGRDPFEHMTRGLGSAKSQVESLTREYAKLAREATAAGRAIGNARPRAGRLTDGREGRRAGAGSIAVRDLAAARHGTAAMIAEEERERIAAERKVAAIGQETTAAMHAAAMASIREEEAARLSSAKRVAEGTSRTERLMQRESFAVRRADQRDAQKLERDKAAAAKRDDAANTRAQETAASLAERDAGREARRTVLNQRRDERDAAKAEARRKREEDRHRVHIHAAAHIHVPGMRGGVGVGGLSVPGALAVGTAGSATVAGVHEAAKSVTDLSNQLTLLKAEGLTKDIPRIEQMASRVSARVPEISKAEAIGQFREQFGLTFDTDSAMRMTERGAERASVLRTAAPKAVEPTLPLAKATESFLGSKLLEKEGQDFGQRLQDQFAKTIIAEKGQLQPNDIKQLIQQSGGSLRAQYPHLFDADPKVREAEQTKALAQVGRQFPILAMTIGGASAGTMINSSARAFNGRMTNSAKREFKDSGLLDPSKILTRDKKGNPDRLAYGAVRGAEKPLIDFVRQNLIPSLKQSGTFDDANKRNWQIDQLTSNQKVAKAIKIVVTDMEQMEEGLKNSERMKGIHEIYADSQKGDIAAGGRAAKGSLETLSATYLEPLIPAISGLFTGVAATLIKASQAGEGNTATKLAAGVGRGALALGGIAARVVVEDPARAANTVAVTALTAATVANTASKTGETLAGAAGRIGIGGALAGIAGFGAGSVAAVGAGFAAYKGIEAITDPYIKAHPQGSDYAARMRLLKEQDNTQGESRHLEPLGPFRKMVSGGRSGGGHYELGTPEVFDPAKAEPGSKFQKGTVVRGGVPFVWSENSLGSLQDASTFRPPASNVRSFTSPFGAGADPGKSTAASLAQSFQPIAASINQGATTFSTAADGLPAKGSAFGEQAGSGLLGSAGAWGSAAGASLAAAASSIRIGVDAPSKVPNTGSPPPPE